VTAASLTITTPDRITLLPTNNPITIDVVATLPNVIRLPYKVLASSLGYSDNLIPDGWYKIVYSVVINNTTTYTYTNNSIITGQVCCCIDKQLANFESCGCSGNSMDKVLWSRLLLHVMKRQVDCGKNNMAIDTLKELKSICAKNKCTQC